MKNYFLRRSGFWGNWNNGFVKRHYIKKTGRSYGAIFIFESLGFYKQNAPMELIN